MKRIPLTKGKYALVDDEDFDWLTGNWKWHLSHGYAQTNFRPLDDERFTMKLHRLLISVPKGYEIDHINGNGLDNQRSNLRLCTHQENMRNRPKNKNKSGYKGVYRNHAKWHAAIKHNGKKIYLGNFSKPEDAAKVYDLKAKELFGEFAMFSSNNK